jgi:Xaa-Pro dipeptidase
MNLPFTIQEYKERVRRVQNEMAAGGLHALILSKPQNIYYLSGNRASYIGAPLTSLHVLVVPLEGDPVLICRKLEEEAVKEQWTKDPQLYLDHEDPYGYLRQVVAKFKVSEEKIGIEERNLIKTTYDRIKQALPNSKLVDVSGMLDKIRLTMNQKEIEYTTKAAQITERGFRRGIDLLKEGASYNEVVGEIESAMYKAGQSEQDSSLALVWGGPDGGGMHDTFVEKKVKNGDLITIEVHGIYNHYRAAAQGTIFVGNGVSPKIKDLYKLVSDMHEDCVKAVRPGVTFEELFEVANRPYKKATGQDYFRRVGGTLGLSLFDISSVRGEKSKVLEGYCLLLQPLTISPLITVTSSGIVTKDGYKVLNGSLKELIQN